MDYVLELCGVSKTFGNVRAVDDLSLQVAEGSFYHCWGQAAAARRRRCA